MLIRRWEGPSNGAQLEAGIKNKENISMFKKKYKYLLSTHYILVMEDTAHCQVGMTTCEWSSHYGRTIVTALITVPRKSFENEEGYLKIQRGHAWILVNKPFSTLPQPNLSDSLFANAAIINVELTESLSQKRVKRVSKPAVQPSSPYG